MLLRAAQGVDRLGTTYVHVKRFYTYYLISSSNIYIVLYSVVKI
jgi:hypothetical protein